MTVKMYFNVTKLEFTEKKHGSYLIPMTCRVIYRDDDFKSSEKGENRDKMVQN